MAKKTKEDSGKHPAGDAFIREHTGSATMINVDGTGKDDNTPTKKQSKLKENY